MSVMSCNKRDCERIMVDTYIGGIGYICDECQEEFKKYLKKIDFKPANEVQIKDELKVFMNERKGLYNEEKISIDNFFNNYRHD